MRAELVFAGIAAILVVASPAANADVTISSGQTQNMTCSGGVCAPTAKKAILNVSDLESLLASGNVEVTTTGSGVQADDIALDAGLTWSDTSTLALDAYQSIAVAQSVSVTGAAGVTVTSNDGGSGGTFSFGPKGSVTFQNLSSALRINGTAYTLTNSVATLASAVLANPNGAFALANSYDASQDGAYSNCPMDTTLNGTIEGLGNTISNLTIAAKPARHYHPFATFVGAVDTTGVVENLRLKVIHYTDVAVGGLAGGNSGYLFGDEVTGSIDSRRDSAGGLVGFNQGTIASSSADVRVKVGCCNGGAAGGLVVDNGSEGTIELSHASGVVSGSAGGAGGLIDSNEGTISQSYATGKVNYGGGLVFINQDGGTISNSYATGAVGGSGNGGGFVQYVPEYTTGTVTNSYSTGVVASGDGGFICADDVSDLGDDYWDTTTSGTDYGRCGDGNLPGITGLTTQQLQSGLPAGFDPKIWAENPKINNGLPYLINNPPEKK